MVGESVESTGPARELEEDAIYEEAAANGELSAEPLTADEEACLEKPGYGYNKEGEKAGVCELEPPPVETIEPEEGEE